MRGVSASPACASPSLKATRCYSGILLPSPSPSPGPGLPSNLKPKSLRGFRQVGRVQCSNSRTPGSGSGDNDSKAVLDAFFLGKAFAEALNERIGSTVGEILSVVGQWQAEQQKQVQDFQEEVLERAKKAREKAAVEVMEEQGVTSKSLTAPSDPLTPVSPPPPGPTTYDPLQDMLKD